MDNNEITFLLDEQTEAASFLSPLLHEESQVLPCASKGLRSGIAVKLLQVLERRYPLEFAEADQWKCKRD